MSDRPPDGNDRPPTTDDLSPGSNDRASAANHQPASVSDRPPDGSDPLPDGRNPSLGAGDRPPEGISGYLLPDPAAVGGGAGALVEWVERLAEPLEAAGFTAPSPGPGRAPEPRSPDPASWAAHDEPLLPRARWAEAAAWAATAEPSGAERRAALLLLTDVLAIGAAPPTPGLSVGIPPLPAAALRLPAPDDSGAACDLSLRATVWRPAPGGRRRVPPGEAALRNRAAGDGRELLSGPECVNAAVAAAEAASRTLHELLDAIVVGCAVGEWRRAAVGRRMEHLGVHAPGALAPVAAAAAVSRLLGLGPDATAGRLGRAEAMTPIHPYRAFALGAPVKLLYGAWGQFLGLLAAFGEQRPAPAPPEPKDADEAWPEDPGAAIRRIAYKKYPGSRALQPVLAAVERLPRRSPATLATVRSVRIEAYPFAAEISGWADPEQGPIARQMHLPTAAALALRARAAGRPFAVTDYRPPPDQATARLVSRTEVHAREFGADPARLRVRRARVVVALADGREIEAEAGAPFDPPSPGAIRQRFRASTRGLALRDPHEIPLDAPVGALFGPERPEPRRRPRRRPPASPTRRAPRGR